MENSIKTVSNIQTLLKFSYGIIPIVAGADKFTNLLVDWSQYINPSIEGMLPFSAHTFMMIVGVIEIIAGFLVLIQPQKGGVRCFSLVDFDRNYFVVGRKIFGCSSERCGNGNRSIFIS